MEELELLLGCGTTAFGRKHRVQKDDIDRALQLLQACNAITDHQPHARDDLGKLWLARGALKRIGKERRDHRVALEERHLKACRRQKQRVLTQARRRVGCSQPPVAASDTGRTQQKLSA